MNQEQQTMLANLYREYLNDFLTVEYFAIAHSMDKSDALIVLEQGKAAHTAGY